MTDEYMQSKTCADCGHDNERWLAPERAAFEERRRLSDWKCAECGSTSYSRSFAQKPPLTQRLLSIWVEHEDLHFQQQDEDLLPLGDPKNLSLILEVIDRPDVSASKRGVLLSGLMVIAHNLVEREGSADSDRAQLREQVLSEVDERFEAIEAARRQGFVYSYLCETVYPLLEHNVEVL